MDLVGISVTVDTFPRAIKISNYYRKKGVTVIVGGIHITCDYKSSLDCFDASCVGAAEDTWPDMINDFKLGKLKKVYKSRLKDGSKIVLPAYNLIDSSKYLFTNIVSTSRGCTFRCSFCYNSCREENTYFNNLL